MFMSHGGKKNIKACQGNHARITRTHASALTLRGLDELVDLDTVFGAKKCVKIRLGDVQSAREVAAKLLAEGKTINHVSECPTKQIIHP
jgi:hypothetical protein